MHSSLKLFFILIFIAVLSFSCTKKETENQTTKAEPQKTETKTTEPVINEEKTVQIPELKEEDILSFINNTEPVSKIDSEYTNRINEAKDNKELSEKLVKERESKIFEYLKDKNINPENYILKSTKIMMAFIGLQMSEDEELLKTQIEYVKKTESDPAKQEETIKMVKQISAKIAEKYLENVNSSEKDIIRKHQKELEKVLANKKIKM